MAQENNFPHSKKIYVSGTLHPEIRVPMREISLADPHAPIYAYDTSGSYTDPHASIDIKKGLPLIRDAGLIVPRLDGFMAETLDGWRRHLAPLEDPQLSPRQYLSRWGEPHTIEQMLEHAVVHPMRHRIQLERILAS